ncbi:MAG: ABC transporter ATP-binding protein [Proteobacteria bacterium]|nr:ABC transporter ATP-binding protein [Pseudomonadota bacterium]
MNCVLDVQQITKKYGEFTAVDGLSMQIAPGESVAFIGPNGAGKSTTMRAIAGMTRLDAGSIRIMGNDVSQAPVEARRHLGFVPQDIALYQHLTGEELLTFVAKIRGLDTQTSQTAIDELLEICDLGQARRRLIREYSGGMARKVAMAAALVARPELVVLDESFVGLDPESTFRLSQYLKRYTQAGGALLLSSHILDMLEPLCTRFFILHKGQCVGDFSRNDLKNMPATPEMSKLTALYLRSTEQTELMDAFAQKE